MNTVFFSWQSDHPETRTFVTRALEDAIGAFNQRAEPEDHLRLDEDARNSPGWADIANVLFQKIQSCTVFVADITPINDASIKREAIPNPNVVFELGYAFGVGHRDQRIVTVVNKRHLPDERFESLPFDIRGRIHVGFDFDCAAITTSDHTILSGKLLEQIEHIVASLKDQPQKAVVQNLKESLLDSEADLEILSLMTKGAEQNGDIDHRFDSGDLELLAGDCSTPIKDLLATLARLAYRRLINHTHYYRDVGSCHITGRGVLLTRLCADIEQTQAQYAAIAAEISNRPQSEQLGMSIGDIAERPNLSYFFVQAILDVWEHSSLLRVTKILDVDSEKVGRYMIEQVQPLLARETAPDAAAKILLEPYENVSNDPLADPSAFSRALAMRDDMARPGFVPGMDSGSYGYDRHRLSGF